MPPNQTEKQKMVSFATSEQVAGAIELLKECRTKLGTVVADTEFQTLVNAITLEVESGLIQRLIIAVDNIRSGKNLNE